MLIHKLPSVNFFYFILLMQQTFVNASSHLLDLKNRQEWINAQKVIKLIN